MNHDLLPRSIPPLNFLSYYHLPFIPLLIRLLLIQKLLHILLPTLMLLTRTIEWSPNRLPHKQPHSMNTIFLIHSKPMINPLRQSHQISRLDVDTNPLILFVAYVKESGSSENITDFLGIVNVFFEECFDFVIVGGEFIRVDCDNVSVGVATIVCVDGGVGQVRVVKCC